MPITGHAVLNACPPLRIERRPPGLPPALRRQLPHTTGLLCAEPVSVCLPAALERATTLESGQQSGVSRAGTPGTGGKSPSVFLLLWQSLRPRPGCRLPPQCTPRRSGAWPCPLPSEGVALKPLNCALSMAENLSALSPGGQTSRLLSHTQTRAASPLGPLQQEPLSCTRRCGRAPPAAPCPSTSAGSCCPGSSCGASSARPGTCPAHPLCSFAPSGTSSAQPANQTTKRSWGGSAHPSRPEGSRNHPAANPMGAPQGPQPRPPGMKTRLGKPAQPPRAHPAWWMVQRRQGRETAQVRGGQAGSWGAAHTVLFIESG